MKFGKALAGVVLCSLFFWVACGHPGTCSGGTGGAGETGGSSGPGGGSPGGSSCAASTGGGGGSNGGGGGGGGGSFSALLYYSAQSSTTIQGAGLAGSSLTPLSTTTSTQGVNDRIIFVGQKFLYASIGNGVEAFTLDRASGVLTNVSGNGTAYPAQGDLVAADPQGRFLFVSGSTNAIDVFQINSKTGALSTVTGSPFNVSLQQVKQLTVEASGKFLYATDGGTLTAITSIDSSTGALAEVNGSPFSLGAGCMQATQVGEFLLGLATCFGLGNSGIHVFSIDTTSGIPTEVSGSPFSTAASAFNFAISPAGQFVYALGYVPGTNSTIAPIEGYEIDATTGALTAISGSPFTSLPTAFNCFFDQSGATMLCSDTLRVANFYALGIDANGVPSLQATLPIKNTNAIDLRYAITD